MPLGQRPGEPKHNPEAANWQRCGSMTDFFLFHNPPLWSCMGVVVCRLGRPFVMYGCRRGVCVSVWGGRSWRSRHRGVGMD